MMDDGRMRGTTAEMNKIQLLAFIVAAGTAVVFCLYFALLGFAAGSAAGTPELEHRINPNDAPSASLVRLPGVGPAKAQAIVTYRQQFNRNDKGNFAFRDCDDLRNVKGIGPVTAQGMCEWLRFQ
jgi:competence ComEA-like helix-hairpin-helix protein